MQVVSDFVQHSSQVVYMLGVGVFIIVVPVIGSLPFILFGKILDRLEKPPRITEAKSLVNYRVKFGGLNDGKKTFYSLVTGTPVDNKTKRLFPYGWNDDGSLYKIESVDTQEVPKVPVHTVVNRKSEAPRKIKEPVRRRPRPPVEKKQKSKSKGLRRVSR